MTLNKYQRFVKKHLSEAIKKAGSPTRVMKMVAKMYKKDKSPVRSAKRSAKRVSPKRSAKRSPKRVSPKRSAKRSPKRSAKRSPRRA